MNIDLTVLICSCDKFYDTWEPVADSFADFWPDCPFDIYLMTNHREFSKGKIQSLSIGDDLDWSSNLANAIKSVKTEYVILWLDDVFLSAKVDPSKISEMRGFIEQYTPSFIRLRPLPPPDIWVENNYGEILTQSLFYRVSIFATVWKKEILFSLLVKGESAWSFELNGSKRSHIYPEFYCTRHLVFDYVHGIEKGIWKFDAVEWLKKRGHTIDFNYRRMMNGSEISKYRLDSIKLKLINFFPGKFRHRVVRFVQKIYIRLGIRKETTF